MCSAHPHVRDRKQRKCDGPLKTSHPRASKNPDFYQRLFFSPLRFWESQQEGWVWYWVHAVRNIKKVKGLEPKNYLESKDPMVTVNLPWYLPSLIPRGQNLGRNTNFFFYHHSSIKKEDDHLRIWVAGTMLKVQGWIHFSLCKSHVFTRYRCQGLLLGLAAAAIYRMLRGLKQPTIAKGCPQWEIPTPCTVVVENLDNTHA